jgi:hypothetical protein
MSNMVENGPNGETCSLPPNDFHDEFAELCALSTTGLLSAEERRRLDEHLGSCQPCREIQAQYRAIVDTGIPAASGTSEDNRETRSVPGWSVEEAEAALFARLEREDARTSRIDDRQHPARTGAEKEAPQFHPNRSEARDDTVNGVFRQMRMQFAAGIILVLALGYSAYRTGIHKGVEMGGSSVSKVPGIPQTAAENSVRAKENLPAAARPESGPAETVQLASLHAQLDDKVIEIERLQAQKDALEESLRVNRDDQDRLRQNAEALTRQLAQRQTDLETTKQRLDAAGTQSSQDSATLLSLQRQIDELKTNAAQRDKEIARERELLDHDQDIRELMGSRSLYIAEVYDVAKTGDTERPFGRVFYTKGKSLIFYAYDLDQQPGFRYVEAFQAWGRRGPDQQRAVNLGILYADNAAKKRWVLKTDDAKTLADIDAVFVTVEPHGGSSHPSGKPLLFAYLRIEPNHP